MSQVSWVGGNWRNGVAVDVVPLSGVKSILRSCRPRECAGVVTSGYNSCDVTVVSDLFVKK